MQELIQEGMSNLCRLCGEDDRECFDLFDDERQEEELLLKIEQSIRIAVSNLVSFLMVLNDSKVRLRLVESIGVQVSCFQLKLSDLYCVSDFPLTYSFDFFFQITQDDGLPTGICAMCYDKITGYATFYQQCHDTQDRLQEFLSIECAMQKSIQCKQETEVC